MPGDRKKCEEERRKVEAEAGVQSILLSWVGAHCEHSRGRPRRQEPQKMSASNAIARKRSTDVLGKSSHLKGQKRNGGGNRRTLSRSSSLTYGDARQQMSRTRSAATNGSDGDVRTVSHALESALQSFKHLDVEKGEGSLPYLPTISIGDSITCLGRDEKLINETKRKKAMKRAQHSQAFMKDHYKYSLFTGEEPVVAPQYLELTPSEHIKIARASIAGNKLGIHNVMQGRVCKGDVCKVEDGHFADTNEVSQPEAKYLSLWLRGKAKSLTNFRSSFFSFYLCQQKSRRIDSENSTILMYCDGRPPTFIPKLDFSRLPNFKKPVMYNTKVAQGHLKQCKPGKSKHGKGLIGLLSLKFGF